jgi:ribosomal protein L11 methyltransferase
MKTRGPIWKVAVVTSMEAEEAVTELISGIFELPVSSYTDVETRAVTVATYLVGEAWKKRRRTAAVQDATALREGVRRIQSCGLDIGSGKTSIQKIRREDWAESWKRHFKPIEIGKELLIKPSWSKRRPKKTQAVIVLDPGLSFGTGQHPTTAFCLEQIVAAFSKRQSNLQRSQTAVTKASFLDIGTGSGILAIAAAKLGYAPVEAFDFDPEAVRITRENARKNGVLRQIHLTRGDVTKLTLRRHKQYDLICANLISTLLLAERARILSRLKSDGVLVLAGILKSEFTLVQKAYEGVGLRLIASRAEKEWRSGAFAYRRPKR